MVIERHKRLAILGVPIDDVTMEETLETLNGFIQRGVFHQVAAANVNVLMNAVRDGELMEILRSCSLVLPDGMPLVWASRLMGTPLRERVTGYNLVPHLVQLAAQKNYGIFLLGAAEECSAGAAAWIERNYPEARVAGRYSPPFGPLHTMNHSEILVRIERAKPDILLVAFGNPKQEKWLAAQRSRLQVPLAMGVGGSLNFLAGQVKYTPRWMQNRGLEAIYRVWQEPRRLGGRYLVDLCGIFRYLTPQVLAIGAQSSSNVSPRLSHFWLDGVLIIRPEGCLRGALVERFEELVGSIAQEMQSVTVDLSRTNSLGPDGLAALLQLDRNRRAARREFSICGVGMSLGRVLRSSRVYDHFRIVPTARDQSESGLMKN
jgi:N-acetylglucosaminyldiphosphoundecaprenol N-acetyl-beta-D-mannosaminyltransferase